MHTEIKSFISEHAKLFLMTLVIAFALPIVLAPKIQAADANPYDDLDVDEALFFYHIEANDITNEYLELLLKDDAPNVSLPPSDDECDSSNISTYCLSVQLNEQLRFLEEYLLSIDTIEFDVDEEITFESAFEAASGAQNFIDDEIEAARDTLDLNLGLYNQLQIVYPVHKELLSVIDNLENYRNNLASIRDVIELYPSKFNDASTTSCK